MWGFYLWVFSNDVAVENSFFKKLTERPTHNLNTLLTTSINVYGCFFCVFLFVCFFGGVCGVGLFV